MRAVLFDMDGLLVDSEPVWFVVEQQVFARLGVRRAWTDDDARSLVGNALAVSAARMVELAESDVAVEAVVGWFVDGMGEQLRQGVPWKPGAVELLSSVRAAGWRTGLVSSSHRPLLDAVLAALPPDAFDVSVAGDEVSRGKPDPEPYRSALHLLGVDAGRSVVLEDSPTGATSGSAAGCTVVLVPDRAVMPADHPWVQVASLVDVTPPWLAELLGGDGGEHVEVGGATRRQDGGEHPDDR
jgi:beta-phosphoglucomutase-like phosphatase (HAD superfamily)